MVSPTVPQHRVRKRKLSHGITLLLQNNPTSKAFCAGVWLKIGSRDESRGEEGLCHFLEHMLFKGTSTRSAFQISQAIEKVGGSLDAFTTKEQICVYTQVLEDHWRLALDVLSDMFMHSTFPTDQISLERRVVLDEIRDAMDAPDDMVHEFFTSAIFTGHPLGRPILGIKSTVARFSRRKLIDFAGRVFRSGAAVIAIYGNADAGEVRRACEKLFRFPPGNPSNMDCVLPEWVPKRRHIKRKLHQQHICLGNRGFSFNDEKRFPLMILSTLLGGGMSSRLFQRVREELGLAYNIYSYTEYGRDTGIVGTYLSVNPENSRRAVQSVLDEFEKIITGGLKRGELDDTKEYLKGSILLGLETAASKMMRMARNEIYFGRQISERELIGQINRVTRDDVIKIASGLLSPDNVSIVSLGPSAV